MRGRCCAGHLLLLAASQCGAGVNDQADVSGEPFTADDLNDLPLGKAFLKFVLNDPLKIAVADPAARRDAARAEHEIWDLVFDHGSFPSPELGYRWPIPISADVLAHEFVYATQHAFGIDLTNFVPRQPSATLRTACTAVADRLTFFLQLLARGNVVAVDMYGRALGATAWLRPELNIDLQTSDLFDAATEERLGHGLMLRPAAAAIVSPEQSDTCVTARTSIKIGRSPVLIDVTKLTPKRRLVYDAVAHRCENVFDAIDWPRKDRDKQIIEDVSALSQCKATVSPSTIKRFFADLKKAIRSSASRKSRGHS